MASAQMHSHKVRWNNFSHLLQCPDLGGHDRIIDTSGRRGKSHHPFVHIRDEVDQARVVTSPVRSHNWSRPDLGCGPCASEPPRVTFLACVPQHLRSLLSRFLCHSLIHSLTHGTLLGACCVPGPKQGPVRSAKVTLRQPLGEPAACPEIQVSCQYLSCSVPTDHLASPSHRPIRPVAHMAFLL